MVEKKAERLTLEVLLGGLELAREKRRGMHSRKRGTT